MPTASERISARSTSSRWSPMADAGATRSVLLRPLHALTSLGGPRRCSGFELPTRSSKTSGRSRMNMLFECPTSVRFPSTLVLVLLLTAAPVHAGIVSTSGAVSIISPPADARLGALENNTVAQLFMEVTGLTLPSSLAVDFNAPGTYNSNPPGPLPTIAAGTIVESYYLITDPVGSDPANIRSFSGTITFSTDVLGAIVLDPEFASSNVALGHPGTLYSSGGIGFELGSPDTFTLSSDRRTITFSNVANTAADNMRIVTAAPSFISGQVTGAGVGLSGAVVDAFNAATGAFGATVATDTSGNYSIPLSPGTYKIKAHFNGFLDAFYAVGGLSGIDFTTATPVTVTNAVVADVNIALPPGGTISGSVHARGTSMQLAGVPVIIFRSGANSFLFRNPRVGTTGSNGSFVFHGLRDGDWIVRVEPQNLGYAISYYSGDPDNPATDGSTATPVRIAGANTVSSININPAPGGGAIRGRILRSDTLAPVSNIGLNVHLTDAPRTGILSRDAFVAGATTHGNRQDVFTGLPTGEDVVQALRTPGVHGTAGADLNGVASGSRGWSPP